MTTLCTTCEQPTDPAAYACTRCTSRVAELLARAADVAQDADDAATGLMRYGSAGRRGRDEPPMLGNPDTRARLAYAGTAITTWARHIADERGHQLPVPDRRPITGPGCPAGWCRHGSCRAIRTRAAEHPVSVAAAWLVGQLGWLRYRRYAAEALEGLGAAARDIIRAADRPPERVIVGACECGTALYGIAGAATATCRACGAAWDVERSRDILRRHLEGALATAAEIAIMALHLNPDLRRHKVRHLVNVWASRGLIVARGQARDGAPTYRVGDVLTRLGPALDRKAS